MAKQKSRFPSYGLVRGPSHAQGGVAGVVAGNQPVELEGGEWVIPKEVVPDYLPQLVQMTNEGRAIQGMDNGNSAIDALIASSVMQNGIVSPKSPHYQAGGKVSFLERLPFIGPQLKGYREYQEADRYIDKRHRGQPLFSEDTQRSGIQVTGETRREVESENDETIKKLFNTAMVNYDPEETSRGIARFSKSDSDESALKKLLIGTPSGYRVSEDEGRLSYAVDPENIARVTPGKKLLGMFPVGYSGSVEPNVGTESQLDFSNLEALKSLAGYEQGGPIYSYQGGGGVPEDFLASLKDKEGSLNLIYKDSLGKPTGGMGHLMTDSELKDYGVSKYIDHPTIYGPRKVAVDAKGDIIQLDEGVTEDWVKNDSEKAYNAALAQAKELGIDNQKMINALGSVNFQLGAGWRKEGKFPAVWEAMKSGDYGLAAENVQWKVPADTLQGVSDWYEQTPTRAKDFMEALRGYKKRSGGPVYGYQQGGQVDSLYKQLSPFQGPSGYGIVPPESTRELRSKLLSEDVSKYLKEIETEPDWYRLMDKSIIPEGELTRDDIMRMRYRQQYERVNADVLSEQFEDNEKMQEFLDYYVTQKPLIEDFERRERMEKSPQGGLRGPKARYARRKQHQQGGPIDYYQTGGQALPRAQKEVRRSIDPGFYAEFPAMQHPITGKPMKSIEMPTLPSMNIDPGFYMQDDQTGMDSLLKQIMMRGVNQATDDSSASMVLDSMKMQQGGMVGGTPLMQDMSQDKRVKPLQPDRYVVTGGKMTKQEMEVPKLSRAYLASFGMETPLSKRQRSVLNRRAIAPETLSPQVKGLIGRILVQRLTNEPE